MIKKNVYILCVFFTALLYLFVWINKKNVNILELYKIEQKGEIYELTIKDWCGDLIFREEYIGEPVVQAINDDTFLIVRGRGDWHMYTFINISKKIVSENYNDISAYNMDKVVYAILDDDHTIKVVVRDIYYKEKYYMEVSRNFSPMAVPHHVIANAKFESDFQLVLEYYVGENLKKIREVIDLEEAK